MTKELTYVPWDDTDVLSDVLVGRSIVSTETVDGSYGDDVIFTLDNGTLLRARSQEGGCACNNGCFTVSNPSPVGGRIMSVGVVDPSDGEDAFGENALRVFVLTDLGEQTLIESEGGDNGYYGWGFRFDVTLVEDVSDV